MLPPVSDMTQYCLEACMNPQRLPWPTPHLDPNEIQLDAASQHAQQPGVPALNVPHLDPAIVAGHLDTLRSVHQHHCKARQKEIFGRMSINGVRGAGGYDIPHSGVCQCGYQYTPGSARTHCFWVCPIAAAVLSTVARAAPTVSFCKHHFWLLQAPDCRVDAAV